MQEDKKTKTISLCLMLAVLLCAVCAFSISARADADEDGTSVITGKDGWLFYDAFGSVEEYQGKDLFTEAELENIHDRLMRVKNEFDDKGIEFVILLAPNKEHIYPEYMPDDYGPAASYTRIEQLVDCLNDDFTVITPLQDLIAAKAEWPQYDFYYKTDTHWNGLGAYIASKQLMDILGTKLPDFGSLKINPVTIQGKDLAQELGIADTVTDTDYRISGYGSLNTVAQEMNEEGSYVHYHTEGAPKRSMVIYGDSFSMPMASFLGQDYGDIYIHRLDYKQSDLDAEEPEVVVYELVERALFYMNSFEITDDR